MKKINIKAPSKKININKTYRTINELYTNFLWIDNVKDTSLEDLLKNSY